MKDVGNHLKHPLDRPATVVQLSYGEGIGYFYW
jgi:hypothetical protein